VREGSAPQRRCWRTSPSQAGDARGNATAVIDVQTERQTGLAQEDWPAQQVVVADATRQALGDRLIVDGPLEADAKGMQGAMRLWEVLALRGEAMLVLPSPVRDLGELPTPIEASLHLIIGERIDGQSYAQLYRLSARGAELESTAPLEVFSALRVLLPTPPGDSPRRRSREG
jgi:hypothetical protein